MSVSNHQDNTPLPMKRLLTILVLIAYLLAGGLCGPSLLCVEGDGCITIESIGTQCCSPEQIPVSAGQRFELSTPGCESSCALCSDIALLTDANRSGAQTKSSATPTPPPCQGRFLAIEADRDRPLALHGSVYPSGKSGDLAHLKTIVLRC